MSSTAEFSAIGCRRARGRLTVFVLVPKQAPATIARACDCSIPGNLEIEEIGLDAVGEMPYPRRLKSTARLALDDDSTANVVRSTWTGLHLESPRRRVFCGPRSYCRSHGCKRQSSKTAVRTTIRSAECRPGCGASNRSRKSIVSLAPLGHNLSGGLFFARKAKGHALPSSLDDPPWWPDQARAFGLNTVTTMLSR
jgi:hypothetical protein